MEEPETEVVIVKRAHRWLVKRDQPGVRTCQTCGKRAEQVAGMTCYEEEVVRRVDGEN
jgi:hypothetical protein